MFSPVYGPCSRNYLEIKCFLWLVWRYLYKCKLTRITYSNIYFCSDCFFICHSKLLLMSCCYSKGRRWMNADNYHSRHHYHQQTQQQHQWQFEHQSLATCTFSVIMYLFLKAYTVPCPGLPLLSLFLISLLKFSTWSSLCS